MGSTEGVVEPRVCTCVVEEMPPLTHQEAREQTRRIADQIELMARDEVGMIDEEARRLADDERSRLVETECARLKREHERRSKAMGAADKIEHSKNKSAARLSVLAEQDQLMQGVINTAASSLMEVHKSPEYKGMLEGLLLQALNKLKEDSVLVQCLERDANIVREAMKGACAKYQTSGKVKAVMHPEHLAVKESVDVPCLGGIVLWNEQRTICCRNTLNVRLQFAYENQMPKIRSLLFPNGAKPSDADDVPDLLM